MAIHCICYGYYIDCAIKEGRGFLKKYGFVNLINL
jgi:hypothetical protein